MSFGLDIALSNTDILKLSVIVGGFPLHGELPSDEKPTLLLMQQE